MRLFAALALLALAPASASAAQLGGGRTTVSLSPAWVAALDRLGVQVSPAGRAKATKAGIRFPITGGRLTGLSGVVQHAGALRLKSGKRQVRLANPKVVFNDRPFLQVEVAGGRLKAFTLNVDSAEIDEAGPGTALSGVRLELSRQGARALNTVFRAKGFKTGAPLASVVVAGTDRFLTLGGGQTSLLLDAAAEQALAAEQVTPSGAEGSVIGDDGSIVFPIASGRVATKTLGGRIDHGGGISFVQENQIKLQLESFLVDTRKGVLSAQVDDSSDRVAVLDLDLNEPQVTRDAGSFTITGVRATLNAFAADAFNQSFGSSAFQAGLTLGTVTIGAVVK